MSSKRSCRIFRRGTVRRFMADRRGVAAIEFAFVATFMFASYFLTMEFSQAIEANKKVGRAATLVGDLVTQSQAMTITELDAIMKIGEAVLQPYNRSQPRITVTAVQITNDATPKAVVVWSRRLANGSSTRAAAPGTQVSIPQKLVTPGAFLIRSEAELEYAPILTWSESNGNALGLAAIFEKIDMGETYYMSPRQSQTISCATC